jgi:polysaccharide export outer membrane protein
MLVVGALLTACVAPRAATSVSAGTVAPAWLATTIREMVALREVAIQGQVKNPGRYPLPVEIPWTVADMVMKAGGITDDADENSVQVTSHDPEGKATQTRVVKVGSMILGGLRKQSHEPEVILQPGDTVFVPGRII